MNYLTNVKNVIKLSEQELHTTSKSSWHDQYKDSAWIYIGGLPFDLTEGDIICIFSQYGEVVNINLIRAKDTGKSKGFCFLCYEDQRSTILAVDNLNGIKILNRTIRVDHVQNYKVPKDDKKATEETKKLYAEGCAPKPVSIVPMIEPFKQNLRETLADQIEGNIKLPTRLPIYTNIKEEKVSDTETERSVKKEKKKKHKSSKLKKSKEVDTNSDEYNSSESSAERDKINRNSEDKYRSTSKNDSPKHRHSDKRKEPSKKSKSKRFGSPKRRDRSRSRERDQKVSNHKRAISPSIPKRWR